MLYGADVAVCSEINTKHKYINTGGRGMEKVTQ
jgi:hypothetical protein